MGEPTGGASEYPMASARRTTSNQAKPCRAWNAAMARTGDAELRRRAQPRSLVSTTPVTLAKSESALLSGVDPVGNCGSRTGSLRRELV